MRDLILRADDLHLSVGPAFAAKGVLGGVSIRVFAGEVLAIVGPSGIGKTTLLRVLRGELRPSSGTLELRPASATVALLPQRTVLIEGLTAFANVRVSGLLLGDSAGGLNERARRMLELLELEGDLDRYPAELSAGMRQRVALARTLLANARLTLLDEPLSALDLPLRQRIARILRERADQRTQGFLMVTHTIEEAVLVADRIYVLSGRPARVVLVASQSEDALRADRFQESTATFISKSRGEIFDQIVAALEKEPSDAETRAQ